MEERFKQDGTFYLALFAALYGPEAVKKSLLYRISLLRYAVLINVIEIHLRAYYPFRAYFITTMR